ncbi:MAG: amidohydrolase family protein [Vicinamibacteraceae bacterium]
MLTRRDALRAVALAPLAMAGCRCKEHYPTLAPAGLSTARSDPASVTPTDRLPAVLRPQARTAARTFGRVIDVHGHFFNASDIPVRGFMAECFGHQAFGPLKWLAEAAAPLADRIAERAPTALEEIQRLRALADACGHCTDGERWAYVRGYMTAETVAAARHVAEVTRNTELLRRYRTLTQGRIRRTSNVRSGLGSNNLSTDEVLDLVETLAAPDSAAIGALDESQRDAQVGADAADGFVTFLTCMESLRARNVHEYMHYLHRPTEPFGVDLVLDAMVDFDYWIDCPPRSPQNDQFALHALLGRIHGDFLRPVVSYNPWTDIEQNCASLDRVREARTCGFVAAKIYPAIGFFPFGNDSTTVKTKKRRPNLHELDVRLNAFFDYCAAERLPVIAHGEHKNGRDNAHDEFGGPTGWTALFKDYAQAAKAPVVSIGHFGGVDETTDWTREFAELMNTTPDGSLYADLGYWDALMCPTFPARRCNEARERLRCGLAAKVGPSGTAADRVMFGTDWFMISQLKGWARYPDTILESLRAIGVSDAALEKIFRLNAEACFKV